MKSAWLSLLLVAMSGLGVGAADHAAQKHSYDTFWRPASATTTTAFVDELFLASDRCPRSVDCIAPRIGPVTHTRIVTYRAIPITLDRRFPPAK